MEMRIHHTGRCDFIAGIPIPCMGSLLQPFMMLCLIRFKPHAFFVKLTQKVHALGISQVCRLPEKGLRLISIGRSIVTAMQVDFSQPAGRFPAVSLSGEAAAFSSQTMDSFVFPSFCIYKRPSISAASLRPCSAPILAQSSICCL